MSNKSSFSLNSSICKRCHLLTVELLPLFTIECLWNIWYILISSSQSISVADLMKFCRQEAFLWKPKKVLSIIILQCMDSNLMEWNNMKRINHVDKSIAHIAFVLQNGICKKANQICAYVICDFLPQRNSIHARFTYFEVNWQINKIISSSMMFINCSKKHFWSIPTITIISNQKAEIIEDATGIWAIMVCKTTNRKWMGKWLLT